MFCIVLSNEGDFLRFTSKDTWRSTLEIQKATFFDTYEEAQQILMDYSIKSIWKDAYVIDIQIYA